MTYFQIASWILAAKNQPWTNDKLQVTQLLFQKHEAKQQAAEESAKTEHVLQKSKRGAVHRNKYSGVLLAKHTHRIYIKIWLFQ